MTNASLRRRCGAMIYDGLLVLAILFVGTLPFLAQREGEPVVAGNLVYQLTLFFITYLFFVGFWTYHARTLGMQSWGLRIETMQGGKPSLSQSTIRFFAALLSWLPVGLGFWWQLFDRDNLTWHDRLSGTRLRYYPRKRKLAT